MSVLKVYKIREIDEVALFLEGGVLGAAFNQNREGPPGIYGLVGLTLTFANPVGSVTFTQGADPSGLLTFGEIHTQVQAAVATVKVKQLSGRLAFIEATPGTGISVAASPAAALLGFDGAASTTGKVYASPFSATPPVAPYLVQAYSTNDNMHVLITCE